MAGDYVLQNGRWVFDNGAKATDATQFPTTYQGKPLKTFTMGGKTEGGAQVQGSYSNEPPAKESPAEKAAAAALIASEKDKVAGKKIDASKLRFLYDLDKMIKEIETDTTGVWQQNWAQVAGAKVAKNTPLGFLNPKLKSALAQEEMGKPSQKLTYMTDLTNALGLKPTIRGKAIPEWIGQGVPEPDEIPAPVAINGLKQIMAYVAGGTDRIPPTPHLTYKFLISKGIKPEVAQAYVDKKFKLPDSSTVPINAVDEGASGGTE